MEKKITIKGKEYSVKEIPYIKAISLDSKDKEKVAREMFKISLGMNDEEINSLNIREGLEINKAIDEVNGVSDFQTATEKKQ